jgi:hypothetical protein
MPSQRPVTKRPNLPSSPKPPATLSLALLSSLTPSTGPAKVRRKTSLTKPPFSGRNFPSSFSASFLSLCSPPSASSQGSKHGPRQSLPLGLPTHLRGRWPPYQLPRDAQTRASSLRNRFHRRNHHRPLHSRSRHRRRPPLPLLNSCSGGSSLCKAAALLRPIFSYI